jgi:hypothetical protein
MNNFYFDICGEKSTTPMTQGKPWCIYLSLYFRVLSTLNTALGNRNCVINYWCISFLEKLSTIPCYLIYLNMFLWCLALLRKQKCFVLKRWCFTLEWEFLQRETYDVESFTVVMGSTSEKSTSARYQALRRVREGSLHVVSPSESFKDRANVILLIEDLLTGHISQHG